MRYTKPARFMFLRGSAETLKPEGCLTVNHFLSVDRGRFRSTALQFFSRKAVIFLR